MRMIPETTGPAMYKDAHTRILVSMLFAVKIEIAAMIAGMAMTPSMNMRSM